jgi:hypothetical protein
MSRITEQLIKAANSSAENDTSINAAKRSFESDAAAKRFFETASLNLRRIDIWNKCGSASEYAIFNAAGSDVGKDPIEKGVFIRIYLQSTGKCDWVRVVSVQEDEDEIVITVRPSYDPTRQPPDTSVVSHFFSHEATNNFCLVRDGTSVSFYVIGIGEKQNIRDAGGVVEAARNVAAANLGYYLGIQNAEWKTFCDTFLKIAGEE